MCVYVQSHSYNPPLVSPCFVDLCTLAPSFNLWGLQLITGLRLFTPCRHYVQLVCLSLGMQDIARGRVFMCAVRGLFLGAIPS